MAEQREVGYLCSICQTNRYVDIDLEKHRELVEQSSNGLATYSDAHYCQNQFMSVNNLHVDHDLNIRSFSLLELPEKRLKDSSNSAIPIPGANSTSNQIYPITKMPEDINYRMVITDESLRTVIMIGKINRKEEEPIAVVNSKNGDVKLEYYESKLSWRDYKRAWYQELVDAIDDLPPTRLGLFIEALIYVRKQNKGKPSDFEIQQLKTLLSAHKIYFTFNEEGRPRYMKRRNIRKKYGQDQGELMDKIIDILEEREDTTLNDLQNRINLKPMDLIFFLLLMENEMIINLENKDQKQE